MTTEQMDWLDDQRNARDRRRWWRRMLWMFHIHRWRTVETLDWATYYESYCARPRVSAIEREGLPPVPTPPPPFMTIGERAVVGMALQECRCGARRSKHVLESRFPPMDRWERKGGTP